jgi:tRNA dimethylallyltransferase
MEVARRFNGEIICADSRTVYKGMDIGTAKPSAGDREEIHHHLLDVANPGESFTAAEFQRHARCAVDDILSRKKLPILAGGSGLYIDGILFDYQFGTKADPALREKLERMTVDELTSFCQKNGVSLPTNVKNKRHLIRAIEQNGVNTSRAKKLREKTVVVGIAIERDALKKRIAARTREMFQEGVVEETMKLAKEYGWNHESMTGNVYPIIHHMLEGGLSEDEAIEHITTADLRLAKKQMTWFRRNEHIQWFDNPRDALGCIEHFLTTVAPVV